MRACASPAQGHHRIDDFGRQLLGAVAARVYEPENLIALFLCVSCIVENGGPTS